MSDSTPLKDYKIETTVKGEPTVHSSQYIRTENESDKPDEKPAETANPTAPEAK